MCVFVRVRVCVCAFLHFWSGCFVELDPKFTPRNQAARICTVIVPKHTFRNGVALFNRGFQCAVVGCHPLAGATIYHANARFRLFLYELAASLPMFRLGVRMLPLDCRVRSETCKRR